MSHANNYSNVSAVMWHLNLRVQWTTLFTKHNGRRIKTLQTNEWQRNSSTPQHCWTCKNCSHEWAADSKHCVTQPSTEQRFDEIWRILYFHRND